MGRTRWVHMCVAVAVCGALQYARGQEDRVALSDDGSMYVGARGSILKWNRDAFEYGTIGLDSNDTDGGIILGSEDYDLDDTGKGAELVLGRRIRDGLAAELRLGFGTFESDQNFTIPGVPKDSDPGVPNFYLPYLDGGMTLGGGTHPLKAGVYGVRYKLDKGPVTGSFEYDSYFVDLGLDVLFTVFENERSSLALSIGPAVSYMNQEFDHSVIGAANGWAKPTSVLTEEEIEEWFLGLRAGVRGKHAISKCLDVEAQAGASLFYHRAELDGDQNIAGGMARISVDDERDDFAGKGDLSAGLTWHITDNVDLGLFYQLAVWVNASTVDNPGLMLIDSEGDSRWVGDQTANLDKETFLTHAGMVQLTVTFP